MQEQKKVQDFAFSTHPSHDFLSQALHAYEAGEATGQIYIDHAPTGTGKSWALSTGTIAHASQWNDEKTIIFLAPEKRHLNALYRDIKKRPGSEAIPVIVIRNQTEALEEHGIPDTCPLRKPGSDTFKLVTKIERAIASAKDPKNADNKDVIDFINETLQKTRQELSRCCKSYIDTQAKSFSPVIKTCEKCQAMFPGNILFQDRKGPMIALMTYEKIIHGLKGFHLRHGKAFFVSYSPFVSKPTFNEIPLPRCFIVCEEFSHGHRRIIKQIEEKAIRVSVFKAASEIVRSFEDAFSKTSMLIHAHNAEIYHQHEKRIEEARATATKNVSSYWLPGEVTPFENGRASVLLTPEFTSNDANTFVTSINPAYSSLFSYRQLGAKLDEVARDTFDSESYRLRVRPFGSNKEMKAMGYASLSLSAEKIVSKVLAPLANAALTISSIDVPEDPFRRHQWATFFMSETTSNNEVSEYIRSLSWAKKRSTVVDKDGIKTADILDEFYLRGYEFLEATLTDSQEIQVYTRYASGSTEAMLYFLSKAGNTVYISSASALIRSAITNCDLDWVRRLHTVSLLSKEAGEQVLREKNQPKVSPEVIWGKEDVRNLLGIHFGEKSDPEAMTHVLNTFAEDLAGTVKGRSRYAILFFNSAANAKDAQRAFNAYLNQLVPAEQFRGEYVDAEWFRAGYGSQLFKDIKANLVSSGVPKTYLLFTTYNSLATGANLHIDFEDVPPSESNFWRYVGDQNIRRYEGSKGVAVDISDIVLVEPVTSMIAEDNFYRVGHQLAALGDIDWMHIGYKVFQAKGDMKPWSATTAAVKQTGHFVAAQFDTIMQSIGRMDRTFNSAVQPKIFLNSGFVGLLAAISDKVIGETILSPTIETVLASARKRLRNIVATKRNWIRTVELSAGEFFTMLAREIRINNAARTLWAGLRSFLREFQVISSADWLKRSTEAQELDRLLSEYGLSLGNFYFSLPAKAAKGREGKYTLWFSVDGYNYTFYDPSIVPIDAMKTWYSGPYGMGSGNVLFVRPDVMRDVVLPAEFEERCRTLTESYVRKKVIPEADVPNYLYERSDLFVPQCDAAIDAKAWSTYSMANSNTEATVQSLVNQARKKLDYMRSEASGGWAPNRYIYAFLNWWPTLEENYGKVAVFFARDNATNAKVQDDWDVAFVHYNNLAAVERVLDAIDSTLSVTENDDIEPADSL